MHSIGYVRISDKEKQDPASQIKLMQDQGINIENIFVDMASGKITPGQRPAYTKMMVAIDTREVSELVFSEYSRLGRDMIESLGAVMDVMRKGIKIRSLSEREKLINEYPLTLQIIMITLSLDAAQREREHISERTRWGLERKKAEGVILGRPRVPINFDKVREVMDKNGLKEAQAIRVLGYKPRTFYAAKKAAGGS
jgi:DNA invertase Pin-like site-specific DNA recombinase